MINLKQLVSVIQKSAISASAEVAKKNLEILDDFFEHAEDGTEIDDLAKSAISAISELDSQNEEEEQKIKDILNSLSDALKKSGHSNSGALIPRCVDIGYPNITSEGGESHNVRVPLLSLVPLNSIQLSKLKFTTDLALSVVDDELQISFPEQKKAGLLKKSKESDNADSHHATLEVVIDCIEPPQGLKKLVEGYDRALRAQIPG
ncbi:DUF2589 domain-containing protein [Kangiella shandongensis]|uniref:DUF2589 domain-containing protein n=1 Tax=Kangiella shandongensis TaxID=2763258 RepID=UPI001CBD1DAA|nr:DUF2589 domain-containing protein [Kangiella shandongensis]